MNTNLTAKQQKELEVYKRKQIKIAKDLRYKHSVIEAIESAESEIQIDQIMIQARKNMESL